MKRDKSEQHRVRLPDKVLKPWKDVEEEEEEEDEDVDPWESECKAPPLPWDTRPPLAYMPEEWLPRDYAEIVRDGRAWPDGEAGTVSSIAQLPAYVRVVSALSGMQGGGHGGAVAFSSAAMDLAVGVEPELVRCNVIGPLEDGWAFSVALWPSGAAYLVIACGPRGEFGWFTIRASR